jgi:ATP-dependent DNA ligase
VYAFGQRKLGHTLALTTVSASEGEAMFRHACAMGLEGIVSKRVTSRYKSGRVPRLGESEEPGI